MEERLKQLEQPLNDFKGHINSLIPPDDNLRTKELLPGVKGYAIEKATTPEVQRVQAAYNLTAILGYLLKAGPLTIARNYEKLAEGLIGALESLVIPQSGDIVIDEKATFPVAQACNQFFTQAALPLTDIFSLLPWPVRIIVEKISKKAPEKTNMIAPAAQVIGKNFEIVAGHYHLKQLSKLTPEDLSNPANHREIRQKLLNVLPANQRGGLSEKFDEEFIIEYQQKCKSYLREMTNNLKVPSLSNLALIISKFESDKKIFEENFLTFFEKTLPGLMVQAAQKQSSAEVTFLLPSIVKEITPPSETPIEPVTKEEAVPPVKDEENVTVVVEKDAPTTSAEEFEDNREPVFVSAKLAENSLENLALEDKEFPVPIEEFDEVIAEQEREIKSLDEQLNALSNELRNLNIQLENLNAQKEQLSDQIVSLEKGLKQEPDAWAEHQNRREDLIDQRKNIEELQKAINAKKLALDPTDKKKLDWLGVNEQGLKSYLEMQEQEIDPFKKATVTVVNIASQASSWWGRIWNEEATPPVNEEDKSPVDYEGKKRNLLANLTEADKRLMAEQEELQNWDEALSQQVGQNKEQLEKLNIELVSLEKETGTLKQKIIQKSDEKTLAEENKKQAEGQKKALETTKEKFIKFEQERLAEQEKRAEEERKRLEETKLKEIEQMKEPVEKLVVEAMISTTTNEAEMVTLPVKGSSVTKPAETEGNLKLESAGKKVKAKHEALIQIKQRYNELKQEYKNQKGFDRTHALLALVKAWFTLQSAKNDLASVQDNLNKLIGQENKQLQRIRVTDSALKQESKLPEESGVMGKEKAASLISSFGIFSASETSFPEQNSSTSSIPTDNSKEGLKNQS